MLVFSCCDVHHLRVQRNVQFQWFSPCFLAHHASLHRTSLGLKFGSGFSQRRSKGIEVIVITSILLPWPLDFCCKPREMWSSAKYRFFKGCVIEVPDSKFCGFCSPFQITTFQHIQLLYNSWNSFGFHILNICWHDWNRKHHTPKPYLLGSYNKKNGLFASSTNPPLTQLPHCKARSLGNHASAGDGYKARHTGSSPATKRHIWPTTRRHQDRGGEDELYKMVLGKMKKDHLKVKNCGCLGEMMVAWDFWGNKTLKIDWGLATKRKTHRNGTFSR